MICIKKNNNYLIFLCVLIKKLHDSKQRKQVQNVLVNSRFVKYTVPALDSSSNLSWLGCLIILIIRLRGANWTMINFYSCISSKTCIFFFLLDRVMASYFTPHASRVTFWRFIFSHAGSLHLILTNEQARATVILHIRPFTQ